MLTRFIWTFTLRSYNYWLHNLAPLKLKTSSSLSCILAPGCFIVIPLLRYSAFFRHSLLCPVLVLYWSSFRTVLPPGRRILLYGTASWQTNPRSGLYCLLADESSFRTVLPPGRRILLYCTASWQTNPRRPGIIQGSSSRSVSRTLSRTVYFPCCHENVALVAARTKVYLAVDCQQTSILKAWEHVY
jgi:hypothetical protein